MIVRGPRQDRYTILNRVVVNDDRLSFRALGLLTFILDKPDNWRIDATELARGESREGRDAVRTALNELEANGYLRRERKRHPNGTFYTDAVIYDCPTDAASTGAGEPGPGNPSPVSQASNQMTVNEDGNDSVSTTRPTLIPAEQPTVCTETPRTRATTVVKAYWDAVKRATGKPPIGVKYVALVKLVEPFMEHYDDREVATALGAMRQQCRPITRQVLEEHLDGRAARRGGTGSPGPMDRARQRQAARRAVLT